jgi:catechol 2,3-dioxygenase-like lactoylglutathione lyase family enzyme
MSGMKLVFISYPVNKMDEALAFYRDALGMEEAWREGARTVALRTNSDVQILLEEDEEEHTYGPGGVFVVDNVDLFFEENKDKLTFVKEPCDIPPGRYAIFMDATGNPIRIIDLTKQK